MWEADARLRQAKLAAKQQLEGEGLLQRGGRARDELELRRGEEEARQANRCAACSLQRPLAGKARPSQPPIRAHALPSPAAALLLAAAAAAAAKARVLLCLVCRLIMRGASLAPLACRYRAVVAELHNLHKVELAQLESLIDAQVGVASRPAWPIGKLPCKLSPSLLASCRWPRGGSEQAAFFSWC